ncbi:hypothetical protein BDW74DRAFT_173730 [Aspergillus multicolor]|uniref:uncharacterized protein n=1 Tax=Aspergillus multicolor TaxID=41759 RepID=UPI003CCD8650
MDAGAWFRNWKSKGNQKLSDTQIRRLVGLTRQWRHDRTPDTLNDWASDPSTKFWGFEARRAQSAWVHECLQIKLSGLEDCDPVMKDIEKASARRRVLLIVLHDIIQKEILRLRKSLQAQPVKYLTAAIKNVIEQAYPGGNNTKLYTKCTLLQRCGRKYSSLTKRELVLTPLHGTSSNFERVKISIAEMEALVAFGEAIYDDEHRNALQKTFERILGTCPHRRTDGLPPRLPSKSTQRRRRKKAARAATAQKPPVPLTSGQSETGVLKGPASQKHTDRLLSLTSAEHRPGSSLGGSLGSCEGPQGASGGAFINVTEEMYSLQAEAQNATLGASHSTSLQPVGHTAHGMWDPSVMSHVPVKSLSATDQISISPLVDDCRNLGDQLAPSDPHQLPLYDPFNDSHCLLHLLTFLFITLLMTL